MVTAFADADGGGTQHNSFTRVKINSSNFSAVNFVWSRHLLVWTRHLLFQAPVFPSVK